MTNKIGFCLSLIILCTMLLGWSPNIVAQTDNSYDMLDFGDEGDSYDTPVDTGDDSATDTPAPVDNSIDNSATDTPAPVDNFSGNSTIDTPAPVDNFDNNSTIDTPTPADNFGDNSATDTPAPVDNSATDIPAPVDNSVNDTPTPADNFGDNSAEDDPSTPATFGNFSSNDLLEDSIPNSPSQPSSLLEEKPRKESYDPIPEPGPAPAPAPTPPPKAPSNQEDKVEIVDMTGDAEQGNKEPLVRDGIYDKISKKEKQILTYDHIREADILWQKRVWRVVDTKQKINMAFTYPDESFIEVLLDILDKNSEEAKIFLTDEFTEQITKDELDKRLNSVDTIPVIDPVTEKETLTIVKNDFDWTSVTKFRMKEDWVFDEESAKMIVRIIAVAPIREVYGDRGEFRGYEAMFWAYYPDFRPFLVKYEAFNPHNDAQRVTWDDMMEMRYFGSYIMKESNIQDRRIVDYSTGKDALLESERIKHEIFEKEQNLWSY